MTVGAKLAGYNVKFCYSDEYREPDSHICAFYGYEKNMPGVMADYIAAGRKVVFLDLGYWGRARKSRLEGYHKVAINGRHPGDYLMDKNRDHDRLKKFGIKLRKWQDPGNHILVAGMSGRAAESIGFQPEEWERWAIAEIQKHSNRPIITALSRRTFSQQISVVQPRIRAG